MLYKSNFIAKSTNGCFLKKPVNMTFKNIEFQFDLVFRDLNSYYITYGCLVYFSIKILQEQI